MIAKWHRLFSNKNHQIAIAYLAIKERQIASAYLAITLSQIAIAYSVISDHKMASLIQQ
jgi:hypothetical protein